MVQNCFPGVQLMARTTGRELERMPGSFWPQALRKRTTARSKPSLK
jgi:hypothetical protein